MKSSTIFFIYFFFGRRGGGVGVGCVWGFLIFRKVDLHITPRNIENIVYELTKYSEFI